jgi:leader peptidase (prepilin peptidase)/N-methyltransferase
VTVVLAALAAALIGAVGPRVMRRLPEPEPDPEDDEVKPLYTDIADARLLAVWLAVGSAPAAALVAWQVPAELVPAWVLFCGVGSWLTYIDLRTRYLPFLLTVPLHLGVLLLVVLAAVLMDDWDVLVHGLVGNGVVFAAFWLIHFLGWLFRSGSFGYGDVRLGAIIGLALGALGSQPTFVGTYAGWVLGAIFGVVHTIRTRRGARSSYAFGPYLVIGAVIGAATA